VASAALAHVIFGQFKLELTASLLVGALPGVFFGSHISSHAPDRLIRPVLGVVLLASALKLLGVPTMFVVAALVGAVLTVAVVTVRSYLVRRSGPEPTDEPEFELINLG